MSGIRTTVRWPAFVVAGVFLVALVGGAVFFLMPDRKPLAGYVPMSPSASAAVARAERASVVADVAPAPLPTALPLLGGEGVDDNGYPKAYVDRPALRALLWQGKFADLDRWFAELQDAFEKDPRKEYWPTDAAESFASAEGMLGARLDAWVAASPGSFAPRLARAAHLYARGVAMRGVQRAKDTPESNFDEMRKVLRDALADVDAALALRPKLVAAMRVQIRCLNQMSRDAEREAAFDRAVQACPACLNVRVTEMITLTPRWGGSASAMRLSAARCDATLNPRCKLLEGFIDWDAATLERDPARRLAAIDRAIAHGDHWLFHTERAHILSLQGDFTGAKAACEKARAERPMEPEMLAECSSASWDLKQYGDAGRDMLTLLRVDPTDDSMRKNYKAAVNNVGWLAGQAQTGGRKDEALSLLELALDLSPSNPQFVFLRSDLKYGPARDVPSLEANVAKNPDDLRAHQVLDYTLAKQGNFARVIEIWTAYLARHPDDARAHFERSGAYYHLQRFAECRADDQRACELGISEACGQLQSLPK